MVNNRPIICDAAYNSRHGISTAKKMYCSGVFRTVSCSLAYFIGYSLNTSTAYRPDSLHAQSWHGCTPVCRPSRSVRQIRFSTAGRAKSSSCDTPKHRLHRPLTTAKNDRLHVAVQRCTHDSLAGWVVLMRACQFLASDPPASLHFTVTDCKLIWPAGFCVTSAAGLHSTA